MTPWLKVRCDLHEDTAVVAAALALGVSENEIVGALVKFWSWANTQTPDGNAPGVTDSWLDRYVGVSGFARTLARVGWLEVAEAGIAVPKFDRHNGASAKRRAQTTVRVQTYRKDAGNHHANVKRECNAVSVTSALRNALPEEEIEEEKEERQYPPTPHGGNGAGKPKKAKAGAEPDGFAAFWAAYPRKEAKRKAVEVFARLSPDKLTLDAILAAVERQKECGCLRPRVVDGRSVVPHASTWLNGRRWEDEPPPIPPHANGAAPFTAEQEMERKLGILRAINGGSR